MTINTISKRIAEIIVIDRACKENKFIFDYNFSDAELEEIETLRNQVCRILYTSNGEKWDDVLNAIKRLSGIDTFLGFGAQDKIISTCSKYGINFVL